MKPVDQDRFGAGHGNCFAAAAASIMELPLEVVHAALERADDAMPDAHWYERAVRVFADLGWDTAYDTAEAPRGYCIASGPAERGLLHSTVALDGTIVHDPHPSRAGLLEITDYIVLTRRAESQAA